MATMRLLVWVCAAILLPDAVAAQTLTFARDEYQSFAGARAIVSADFNRDGWPDLAQANTGRNTVTVLLNQHGDGFRWVVDILVGTGPFDLTTADFNRDGIPDLAVANADANAIAILLGLGDGRFTQNYRSVAPLLNPRGITTADWNKDGIPDLIVTGYLSKSVQVLIGAGDGSFRTGPPYVGPAAQPQGVATADFNHDGFVDAAVAYDSTGGLRILYGDGGATFTARTIVGDAYLNVVATGDFNADGWMDVAAASTRNNAVGIYAGSPTGLIHTHTYATGGSPRGVTVADVNADGALDVITANRLTNTVSILLGDRAHPGAFLAAREFAAGSGSRAVVAADLDHDGLIDLATANEYANGLTVLVNSTAYQVAAFAFQRETVAAHAALRSRSSGDGSTVPLVASDDFDGDGRPDFVIGAGGSAGAGDAIVVLSGGSTVTLPWAQPLFGIVVDDFNADGDADVLSYGIDSAMAFLGNGRGHFTAMHSSLGGTVERRSCSTGDLNRDGAADLVCGGMQGEGPLVFLSHRDGVVVPAGGQQGGCWGAAVVDFNRDGRLDVVCGPDQIFLGDGTGTLTRVGPECDDWSCLPWLTPQVLVGDVNEDGYPDLIPDHGINEASAAVYLGGPDGYQRRDLGVYDPEGFVGIAIGDVNADGHLDVIVNDDGEYSGWCLIAFGRGDGTFDPSPAFALSYGPVLAADVNRDGLLDLVGFGADRVDVLVNTRSQTNHPPVVPDFATTVTSPCFTIDARASDPDQHALAMVRWFDESGEEVYSGNGPYTALRFQCNPPGVYRYSRTADDGRGGTSTGTVIVTVVSGKEIVLYPGAPGDGEPPQQYTYFGGNWWPEPDPTAAGGYRAYNTNRGAPKVLHPDIYNSIRVGFSPDSSLRYKLWIRLKADNNSWANDSVWVQFSDAIDEAGNPVYQEGTDSALSVNLEECSGCGEAGWGWEDDGWGAVNKNGVLLRFSGAWYQVITISTREDGVSIDQIVLSVEKYLTKRPGAARNDHTILPKTYPK